MSKKNKVNQPEIKTKKQLEAAERAEQNKQRKIVKNADKAILKEAVKVQKATLKTYKKEHQQARKDGCDNHNENKDELQKYWQEIKDDYYEKVIGVKNQIAQLKYDFGIKYSTLNWKLFRWMYGIKKEFYRVIWSDPSNTFKYLAIIVIVVTILSLLCFGIDLVVNQYIN